MIEFFPNKISVWPSFLGLCLVFISTISIGQPVSIKQNTYDESYLYSQTKQLNQFIRRFNSEEDSYGKVLTMKDSLYHNLGFRKTYIPALFDNEGGKIADSLKKKFARQATNPKNPLFLNFYEKNWYAEVSAKFRYKGKVENTILYLKLVADHQGYKWVISNVYFPPFKSLFQSDTTNTRLFIQPLSHEIDFMTLNKVFHDEKKVELYTDQKYKPDYLTLFFYEIKKSEIKFMSVDQVKFHFLQLDNWYFEVTYFNRKGYNTGWLISGIQEITKKQRDEIIHSVFEN